MAVWFAVQAAAAGVSLLAKEKASKAAYGSAMEQARLYDLQAERIQEAAGEQIRNVQFEGQKLEGAQVVAYAASGVDSTSGSAMAVMNDTARQINQEITSIKREADFQSSMTRMGAQAIRDQAKDQRKAQQLANYVGFATSVTSAASDWSKYAQTQQQLEATTDTKRVQERQIAYQKGEYAEFQKMAEQQFGGPAVFDPETGEFYRQGEDLTNINLPGGDRLKIRGGRIPR